MERLLAKSYNRKVYPDSPPDYALLTQHSRDVAAACRALARQIGKTALANAGLSEDIFDIFKLQLVANGWIQDLGKMSSHFQEMVTEHPQIKQLLRHEVISGLLMCSHSLPFRKWLAQRFSDSALYPILWSAIGHHRKFDKLTKPEIALALTASVSHPDFKTILEEMSEDLGLASPPVIDRDLIIGPVQDNQCDIPAREALHDLQDEFLEAEDLFDADADKRLLALIKGLGIAADVAASAIAFRGQSINKYSVSEFVQESLNVGLSRQDLQQIINQWAWNRSALERPNGYADNLPADVRPYPFQLNVAGSKSYLTFAQAGCGSGKSLAAYMWAHEWCQRIAKCGRTNFRLFFCLPTTGTSTEHFKDYALESGLHPRLMSLTHSRSSIDLRSIAQTVPQEDSTLSNVTATSAALDALNAERDKMQSLALWSTPLVVATTDTVLGLMVNARRSIYSLPALMSGAFVFDEIHAFDDQLFGHLLVFLKHFPNLPVLLMTASLPKKRIEALKQVRPDIACVPGPPESEELRRYLLREASDATVNDEIQACLCQGGKVLWIRNRVEWANQTYEICRDRFTGTPVHVYHSRFRYKNRSVRHRKVIDAFKDKSRAAILVATQVAEMSLDLSADLLVSDLAPIPSLIQRMGRLNRTLTADTPEHERTAKAALICPLAKEPKVEAPYDASQLADAKKWISLLIERNKPLSQNDLSTVFAEFTDETNFDFEMAEQRACFFSGLWQTRPGSVRGEGYTITVILERDKKEWTQKYPNRNPSRDWLREHEVSIPIHDEVLHWEPWAGLRIAPSAAVGYDYDENTDEGTGARWLKR